MAVPGFLQHRTNCHPGPTCNSAREPPRPGDSSVLEVAALLSRDLGTFLLRFGELLLLQIALRIERGHASGSRSRHRLAVGVVHDVA